MLIEEKQRLNRQEQRLKALGWPRSSCHAYRRYVLSQRLGYRELNRYFHQTRLVGNPLYMRMLRASRLSSRTQLHLILDRHLQSFVDADGFLQLAGPDFRFDSAQTPLSPFYAYFRQLVRDAYPTGLCSDELGRRIHLFRAYLDRQNIAYIRNYSHNLPANAQDLDRIRQFAIDHHTNLDFKTAAAYHNRSHIGLDYPRNMKVQLQRNSYLRRGNPARMIEFIFDIDSGALISEWNVYRHRENGEIDATPGHYTKAALCQVANTESFNYGIPHGRYFVWPRDRRSHHLLDVLQPKDSQIRAVAKRYWKTPTDYADLIKGIDDVLAWRRIPKRERAAIYRAFTADVRNSGKNNGINRFLLKSPALRPYHIDK